MELFINHVTKDFKDKRAVDDVTLHITPGVWGLLGANGAGKTSLMRMIAGISKPSSGEICYDGVPIQKLGSSYREVFGYLPQDFGFYPEFTVQDYLEYMSALKGLNKVYAKQKISELLERLSLTEVRRKRINKLSGGMRRRVGIAQALLNEPEMLVLDEPTSGLDPGERIRFRKLISEFAQDRIVLISTHIVPDVEYIAAENAIMKNGGIVAVGTSEELVSQIGNKVWNTVVPVQELGRLEQRLRIVNLRNLENNMVEIRYLADEPFSPSCVQAVPHLEDLYLWLFPQEGGADGC